MTGFESKRQASKDLLEQALDALSPLSGAGDRELCNAIRAALAQPQAKPYGHVTTHRRTGHQFFYRHPEPPYLDTAKECIAVYATPQAQPAVAEPLTGEKL